MNKQKIIQLTPPRLSPEYIQKKIICIRAHRERIFRIATEIKNDKLICHNYGQGGAGWTFLFGSVNESIRQFEYQLELAPHFKKKPITIIGAGCYGLLTAILLARKGYNISIVAKEFSDLPSYKAAGFFFPRPRKCSKSHECAIFEKLGMESYKDYQAIINNTHPFIGAGPKIVSAYYGLDIDPGFDPYISQKLIDTPEKVTINFGYNKYYEMWEYKTIFINPEGIMDELVGQVARLGITVQQRVITNFDDIPDAIIFNCANLGARELTGDSSIVPVQGHLITLKNQPNPTQLQYMVNVKVTMVNVQGKLRDELIYFSPKGSGILGITFLRGQDSLSSNYHEFDRLLQRSQDFFGSYG
ncbi:MAG TPA: FAD-dependent oxidoreductase [Candidatus Babeliaceae bacterium]|nr:FAD-dependent oxidoreductase [Candidatus Babeliaceae bacterium]